MNDHDIFVQNKFWSPRMIKLTAIGNYEVAGGVPQSVFVNPQAIFLAVRSRGAWTVDPAEQPNPRVECTTVWLQNGGSILVCESPAEVSMRRDRALEVPVDVKTVK